jgi:hypothetical protein
MKYLKLFENFKKHKWEECADCGKFPEDYWFNDWLKFIPKSKQNRYICISCLEKRVGRKLKKSDFKPWNHYYKGQEWYENLEESYNNFNDVKGEIEDIKFILQDLKDDEWVVNIDFVPKRWENPSANFSIESDNIKIYIKKKNCKSNKYPLNSEFKTSEIKDEISQILSIYNDSKIEFKICTADRSYKDENHKHYVEIRNYLLGKWKSMSVKEFTDFINSDNKLLGMDIKIYLNTKNLDQIKKFESFNIDEDSEHLKDLSLDLKDEGEWSINVYTNTEKYNDDEYSCKVILEPLDEFDWDADTNSAGAKINDTMIQYLEDIVKYMEDYDYKIIICDTDQDPFFDGVRQNTIVLENLEKFNQWIKKEIGHQGKTKSTEVGDSIVLSTEYPDFLNFGYKGDFIIIEFYEKELF